MAAKSLKEFKHIDQLVKLLTWLPPFKSTNNPGMEQVQVLSKLLVAAKLHALCQLSSSVHLG